jgi:hypothetical protein
MELPRNLIVRQLFPTPDPPAPTKMRCVSVWIPDSMDHLAAFAGALALLGKWNSWQKDDAHTAAAAALAWQQCLLRGISDCETGEIFDGIWLEDDVTSGFRVDPDNNCILQAWCIDHWETFWDISTCVAENATQGGPGGELTPGGCQTFHVALQGNSKYLVPVPVDDGYTVHISNAQGGWWDGNVLHAWNCPSGLSFAFGACLSAGGTDGGSPIPSLSIGRLIAEIDGTFYDAFNRTIVVPNGTGSQNMYFQMNDASLADNQGSISFDLTVCAKPSSDWCHRWLSDAGIGALSIGYGSFALGGTAIESCTCGSVGNDEWTAGVIAMSGTVTSIEMDIQYNNPDDPGNGSSGFATDGNAPEAQNLYSTLTPAGAGTATISWSGTQVVASALKFFTSSRNNAHARSYILAIRVNGEDVNPFGSDNC